MKRFNLHPLELVTHIWWGVGYKGVYPLINTEKGLVGEASPKIVALGAFVQFTTKETVALVNPSIAETTFEGQTHSRSSMQSGSPVENSDNTATFRRSVIPSVSPVSGERIADLAVNFIEVQHPSTMDEFFEEEEEMQAPTEPASEGSSSVVPMDEERDFEGGALT
ncbi:hypothetical protein AAC387_Pa08g1423 [Persea americana]